MNLRELVREVLDSADTPDPGAVADEVMRRIPPDEYETALRQTLRSFVRLMSAERRSATRITEPRRAVESPKVAAIREHWRKALRDSVHVGDAAYRFLEDCGFDDLMFAAQERRTLAKQNLDRAGQYEALAQLLIRYGVETVRELPEDVLATVLVRAA